MKRTPLRQRPFETDEAKRLEGMGLVDCLVRHKKTGLIGILKWSGRDFHEDVGIKANGIWITVFSDSEVEVLEKANYPDDEYCYYPNDES